MPSQTLEQVLASAAQLLQQRRHEQALALLEHALVQAPGVPLLHVYRGVALHGLRDFARSVASYDQALSLGADGAMLRFNRGNALGEMRRFDEALADYDRALALQPEFADARRNRGILKLLLGDYAGGFSDYEARRPAQRAREHSEVPEWRGEPLAGKSLLVTDATGFGDEIHMVRYLPLLAARGARVGFHGKPSLYRLLGTLAGEVEMLRDAPGPSAFDYHCKLLSLPFLLGTDRDSVPATVPYLRAEPELVRRWGERIGAHGFRVGIGWKGNPSRSIDAGRSLPLAGFQALAAVPGVRLLSLQKRFGLEELEHLPAGMRVETLEDFDEGPDAFVDTAAVMENMDLVVSSCTSLPHLAGALARPVWLAAKFVPEWRWGREGEGNPWYPTMRVFRQSRQDDWQPVFAQMAAALARLAPAVARA